MPPGPREPGTGPPLRRVVGLGLCVVDHAVVVDGFAGVERLRYRSRLVSPGGMTTNAVYQAAALGVPARLLTALGAGDEGRWLRRRLRGDGIDVRGVLLAEEIETTACIALVRRRDGERRFLVADRRRLEARAPAFDLAGIDRHTVLLLDGHFPEQAVRAARRARSRGGLVIGDFSDTRSAHLRLLPHVDLPIVPRSFARAFGEGSPRRALRRLRERYGGTPVVTLGARGGLYLEDGRVRRFEAVPARVRDTTGAGDVFHGAVAAALVRGASLPAALRIGAHAAARNCTALGGHGRLLDRTTFERMLRRGPP